ncbi:FAD dependent oxidoreductase [Chitinophaga costaii]|uniref:FAD dependent oxidoreductase n=1 Tax=Chitinophaga costaii TaxID=1335309 RepID=A0A1C4FYG2_9BACT|nr:FAD-dependent oxidoreductase [Chitinophaga costaii]PUZ20917.1 FAD-dependent oxidoreductase [Chitinophaga costaii]SCC60916.1 FAD dependent oxidoreductase [Chitinophaga costaii]
MQLKKKIITLLSLLMAGSALHAGVPKEVDICVYGGTSAGVIAAYTAKQLHKSVLLISPDKRLGGLSSGGLGYTDIGNKYAITGISRNFYRRIGAHYGKLEQWIFEPHVAEETFHHYMQAGKVDVFYDYQLTDVKKVKGQITEITVSGPTTQVVKAKMFIDCSYEGDLMAKAGVSYKVGREANEQYHETYNGVQLRDKHQFPDGIDPYKIPGHPESGLLWGISPAILDHPGAGDTKVQAYNFRICLSNQPGNMIPITQPADYDPARYELLLRLLQKIDAKNLNAILKFDLMQNGKTDINNNGAFSTDMIGMNYDYPEADVATRKKIIQDHENYTKGLLYFIGHDERMPQHLRDAILKWGYPKDEYPETNHWTPQLYVREARRMVGEYVMTQANCEGRETVTDGVGMAAYTMDSHNIQRIVVNGMVKNEGDVQIGGFGPYPVSYRALVPKPADCTNLLVPVCLSATHIAYGSIRMEPVFMVLAQSAATAAAVAIDAHTTVQQADVKKIQAMLIANPLADNSTPEILVDNDDEKHVTITGNWTKDTKGCYGPSMLTDNTKGATPKRVRFTPDIRKKGRYHIYTYIPRLPGHATVTLTSIFDGKTSQTVKILSENVKVEGQTSGEWADLGTYQLSAGSKAYVEIGNDKADGAVVADAVLFIPE